MEHVALSCCSLSPSNTPDKVFNFTMFVSISLAVTVILFQIWALQMNDTDSGWVRINSLHHQSPDGALFFPQHLVLLVIMVLHCFGSL